MSLRKGLLMAILLVLAAAYVLRLDRQTDLNDHTTVTAQKSLRVFPDISEPEVTSIRVIQANQTFAVSKQKDDSRRLWRLDRPLDAPASSHTMERIVHLLVSLESGNIIAAKDVEEDQSVYGLAPPELFLTVLGSFGERKMSFGKKHPVSGRRYLQPENDGRIFLIDEALFDMLSKPSDSLRERHPGTFEPGEVQTIITLNPEAKPMVFRRMHEEAEGIDHWQLQSDSKEWVADADVIHRELTELAGLEAKEFVDNAAENLMLLGLSQPKLTIRLTLSPDASGKPRDMLFQIGQGMGIEKDEANAAALRQMYYMKLSGEPWVYRFDKAFFRDWLQPAEHFLDRTPFDDLSGEDFSGVRIEHSAAGQNSEFVLERSTDERGISQWKVAQGGERVPAVGVDQWLEHFFTLKVISYPALGDAARATYGFDTPMLKITLEPLVEDSAEGETPAKEPAAKEGKETAEQEADEPAVTRKTLIIGNVVEQVETDQKAQGASVSPRYGGIVDGSGQPIPVLLSGVTVEELQKSAAYFSKK